jgi:hypothetical protein
MPRRMAGIGLLVGYDDNSDFKGFDSEDNIPWNRPTWPCNSLVDFMDLGIKWQKTFLEPKWGVRLIHPCDLYTIKYGTSQSVLKTQKNFLSSFALIQHNMTT